MDCPWSASTQLPPHYCEENLCAYVAQPVNTWSNLGYLLAALVVLSDKKLGPQRFVFAALALALFTGSTLYHMTGTYWGRDLDVGAMLLLSAYVLGLAARRLLQFEKKYLLVIVPAVFVFSAVNIRAGLGGALFVLQVIAAALAEIYTARAQSLSIEMRRNLTRALVLFVFAMILNLTDMNRLYCLPSNSFLTLHAVWHWICAYCLYLIIKYFCLTETKRASINT